MSARSEKQPAAEGGTRRKRNRAKHGVRGKKVEDTEYASSRREADGEDEAPTALTSQGVTSGEDKEGEDSSFGNKGKWGLGGRVLRLERTR